MASDLITIFATVVLIATCIYGLKTKYRSISVGVLVMAPLPIFFALVINIPVILSPFTAKFQGKIIDAETNLPLPDINIKAGWIMSSASVGGGYSRYYKLYATKTDRDGKFTLPRGLKALNTMTPIGTSEFGGVNVTIYPSNYGYKVTRINYTYENNIEIKLQKVKTDADFIKNINDYYYGLFLMHKETGDKISEPFEKKWLKNSYYEFEKLFPKSKADTDYDLDQFAKIAESIDEPETSVYILRKIIEKYPNSNMSWRINNHLNYLKRAHGIK